MISPIRSRLARWSTTLTVKAKPSSRTSAAAACLCLTERTPAIRSAHCRVGVLERDLDVLQPGLLSRSARGRVKPEPRCDQRRVEAQAAGVGGELLEVLPHQRLTAREAELQHAELPRLGEDPLPVVGGELALGPDQVERIGAVGTVQRTAMRQLRQQRGGMFTRHGSAPVPPADGADTR